MKTNKNIDRVLIFANIEKNRIGRLIEELLPIIETHKAEVLFEESIARLINEKAVSRNNIPNDIDMVISLGGDGTMLAAARMVAEREIPILGINLGHLGFLNELDPSEIASAIPEILAGKYKIDSRMMIEVLPPGRKEYSCALNEMVLERGESPRIISHKVFISGDFVAAISADGIIVSTPTGSTAYNMAAGGGILAPSMEAFQVTPLSPYTLAIRSLVAHASETIEIEYQTDGIAFPRLTLDGQATEEMPPNGSIKIRKAPFSAHFVHYHNRSFYKVLRDKLGWANSPRPDTN